jgi:hypothetical protein
MENRIGETDAKSQIMRVINNLFLSYPEFAFFAKIIAGVLVLGIVYSIVKLFV